MIGEVDPEGSGKLSFEDFLTLMSQKMSEKDSKQEILKAFRLFNEDGTGKISFQNLKRVANELGENLTDEELQEMIDEADCKGDGEVTQEEFLRIMKKTSIYQFKFNNRIDAIYFKSAVIYFYVSSSSKSLFIVLLWILYSSMY